MGNEHETKEVAFNNFASILIDKLKVKLQQSNKSEEFLILLDGKCVQANKNTTNNEKLIAGSHLVYLKAENLYQDSFTALYLKTEDKQDRTKHTIKTFVPEVFNSIGAYLGGNNLNKTEISTAMNIENCSVRIDNVLRIIIIESECYCAIRTMLEKNIGLKQFQINETILDIKEVKLLVDSFKTDAFINYYNTVYKQLSKRIMTKLFKTRHNRFYKIMHAFKPVFIDYIHLYNPLLNGDDAKRVTISTLYKKARETDRKVCISKTINEIDTSILSAYLLTDKEISQGFNLKSLMRFTPTMVYELFVGQLRTDLVQFPNANREVMVRFSKDKIDYPYKNEYNIVQFQSIVQEVLKEIDSENEQVRTIAKEKMSILEQYRKIDLLTYYVVKNRQTILKIEPTLLNTKSKLTVEFLRDILQDLSLIGGVN